MDPYGPSGSGAGGWGHHWGGLGSGLGGGLPPGMPLGSMPSGMSCSVSGSIPSGMHCMTPHLPLHGGGLGGALGGGLGGPPAFMGSMPSVHGGLTPSGLPPGGGLGGLAGLGMPLHGPHAPLPHLVETYRNSCPVHSPYRFHFANGGPSYFSQQVSAGPAGPWTQREEASHRAIRGCSKRLRRVTWPR